MAGRLWTKGVAWKKTAIKLLAESNHCGLIPPCEGDKNFTKPYEFSPLLPFSQGRSMSSFNRWIASSTHHLPTTNIRCTGGRSERKNTEGSFLKAVSNIPLLGGRAPTQTFSCDGIFEQGGRNYSTSTTGNSLEDSKMQPPKVGIISSMFNDDNGEQPRKKEEPTDEDKQEKKDEKTESPFLRSQRIAKWMLIGTFSITTPLLIYEFGPPKRDEFGNAIKDQFSNDPAALAYVKRAWSELKLVKKDIVEPSSQKLLPDRLQPPYYQPPYTLVIELFDVLLHPVYDQVHGWRFKKRPGIDYFLEQVGPLYEIVIFTRETGMTAYPLIDSMDPKGYILYKLFRDAARFKSEFKMGNILKGEFPKLDSYYQKDLTYLNRDLNCVIVVDNDKRATELQPSNGITLKPWDGSSTDMELFDLAAFLRTVAASGVDDVRPVLDHYRKYEDPLAAFKLAQARMHEVQQKMAKELQENRGKSFLLNSRGGSGGFSTLTNFFKSRN